MTTISDERLTFVERLEYVVGNPSAWPEGFNDNISELIREAVNGLRAQGGVRVADVHDYDAGLLNGYGGGDVDWWWDYLRAEIGRANDHWRDILSSIEASPAPVSEPDRAALRSIHRKLAEEGGGTWATYMMVEIASAYNDLEIVEPTEAALAALAKGAAPEPASVSEEMVERACVSFGIPETNWFDRAKMRAALTAALAAKGGQ